MNLKQLKQALFKEDPKFKEEYEKDNLEDDLMDIRIKHGLTKEEFKKELLKLIK